MGRLSAVFYDRLIAGSEAAGLADWREDLLAGLEGRVLEIGAGTGLNLAHYTDKVDRLILSEPDRHMRNRLETKVSTHPRRCGQVGVIDAGAEYLPFPNETFNAVVSTLVLCSVDDPPSALSEVHRVLKPGGTFAFIEHVAAEDRPRREKWQRRIEPVWKRIADNCHLTRDTATAIEEAGFDVSIEHVKVPKAAPFIRPAIRGTALKVA